MSATTRFTDPTLPEPPALYLALELSNRSWKLAFSTGHGQKPRFRNVPARDLDALIGEIALARTRFELPDSVPVISCFEAGRDGFWIHRFLHTQPHCFNLVVDSASIEVNRRLRRLKTDRIDARKLLSMLIRYHNGEFRVWSVVHVPSPEAEDARHLHRELLTLKSDRTRITNRIKGLLAAQGLSVSSLNRGFLDQLDDLRLFDGSPLYPQLRQRLSRVLDSSPPGSSPSSSSLGDRSRTAVKSPASPDSRPPPTRAAMTPSTRASLRPATPASVPWPSRSLGGGSSFNPTPPSPSGTSGATLRADSA